MKELENSLASKIEANNVLYLGYMKIYIKIEKIQRYDLSYSLAKSYFEDAVGHKII